jgi:hypothetical protein
VKEKMMAATAREEAGSPTLQPVLEAASRHSERRCSSRGADCDLDGEISRVGPWRCPTPWRHVRDGENLI